MSPRMFAGESFKILKVGNVIIVCSVKKEKTRTTSPLDSTVCLMLSLREGQRGQPVHGGRDSARCQPTGLEGEHQTVWLERQ